METNSTEESKVKIKLWKFVTLAEKDDLHYMVGLEKAYKENIENYETNVDYVKVSDQVTKLKKQKKIELEKLEAEEAKAIQEANNIAIRQARTEELVSKIDDDNIYFVANQNKYLYYDHTRNIWDALTSEATYKLFRAYSREEKGLFDSTLSDKGHNKIRVVNTFKQHTEQELNLIDRTKWLQPISLENGEQVDEWIDLLITSVTGESQGAKDHLEQAIAWKYCHPEDYKIPAQSPYGKGGAGKNKFIEMTLAAIFGREQIAVIGTEEAFGNFNGQMMGKTIVFIDEAVSEKSNSESLKRKVMNSSVNINVKHGIQGTFDSTALFFISGNGTNGAIKLAGDVTDRRFSLYHNERSMFEIISSLWDVYWNDKNENDPGNTVMKDLYDDNEWRFGDPTKVGKWLGYIIEKWIPTMKAAPRAYHDKEYAELVEVNKAEWQSCLECVFNPQEQQMAHINHITSKDLFTLYELVAKYPLKKERFYNEAKHWLKKTHPDWLWDKITINITILGKKQRTSTYAFVRGGGRTFDNNTDHFIEMDEFSRRPKPAWWVDLV